MTNALFHRGPDDEGLWVDEASGVALGHRRLAIVELSPAGHQPMISLDGRYVLAFNGEIYNHSSLRAELAREGQAVAFRGTSDTETLLACFERWGILETLQKSLGMFALALWDRQRRVLTLARDRLGEKPLYFGWTGSAFLFGSELAALTRYPGFDNPIDPDVLALYMQYGYVPAPYSIYRSIFKLEPGAFLTLDLARAHQRPSGAPGKSDWDGPALTPYWSLEDTYSEASRSPFTSDSEAINALETTLKTAVSDQLMADVPVGAFLSGGIDSSTVVALMKQVSPGAVRTFTIGFSSEGFNEAVYAADVARHLGTDHTELYVTPRDAMEVIPRLPAIYSEPFADSSQIPTFLVSQLARQHVTVALSGDGGDELFGGYNRHIWARKVWGPLYRIPWPLRRVLGTAMERAPASAWRATGKVLPRGLQLNRVEDKARKLGRRLQTVRSLDDLYRSLVTEWSPSVIPAARKRGGLRDDAPWIGKLDAFEDQIMVRDSLTYLPDDILQKVDRAAMSVSLETRVPMLDRRVVEVAARTPLSMKLRDGKGKWVLRQVLARYVPDRLIERPKAGFAVPVGEWLRDPLRDWAESLLSEKKLAESGLLDVKQIRSTWAQHLSGATDATPRLWSVLMFQAWSHAGAHASSERAEPVRQVAGADVV